jgi:hypothetical protein
MLASASEIRSEWEKENGFESSFKQQALTHP